MSAKMNVSGVTKIEGVDAVDHDAVANLGILERPAAISDASQKANRAILEAVKGCSPPPRFVLANAGHAVRTLSDTIQELLEDTSGFSFDVVSGLVKERINPASLLHHLDDNKRDGNLPSRWDADRSACSILPVNALVDLIVGIIVSYIVESALWEIAFKRPTFSEKMIGSADRYLEPFAFNRFYEFQGNPFTWHTDPFFPWHMWQCWTVRVGVYWASECPFGSVRWATDLKTAQTFCDTWLKKWLEAMFPLWQFDVKYKGVRSYKQLEKDYYGQYHTFFGNSNVVVFGGAPINLCDVQRKIIYLHTEAAVSHELGHALRLEHHSGLAAGVKTYDPFPVKPGCDMDCSYYTFCDRCRFAMGFPLGGQDCHSTLTAMAAKMYQDIGALTFTVGGKSYKWFDKHLWPQ